eukprot:15461270-Alexandrium_andersonii.AAC.1
MSLWMTATSRATSGRVCATRSRLQRALRNSVASAGVSAANGFFALSLESGMGLIFPGSGSGSGRGGRASAGSARCPRRRRAAGCA